jgi:pilus assembly protein Flp/PilA
MTPIKTFFSDLRTDEDGASFLEYTVLLGIILAVTIATITAVGTWAGDIWGYLCDTQLVAVGTVAACTTA